MKRSRRGPRHPAPHGIFAAGVQVFRLYPDGTVLDVLVKPAPGHADGAAVARWLRREEVVPGVHTARYERQGAAISFTTRSHVRNEDIAVRGTWADGRLTLGMAGSCWKTAPRTFIRLDQPRPVQPFRPSRVI
ncbi:hypothetical protein [Streptomyces sp. NPDC055287]